MALLLPLLTANAALRSLDEATLLPLAQCAEYRVLDRLQASHSVQLQLLLLVKRYCCVYGFNRCISQDI
jgi:hypothetical protein